MDNAIQRYLEDAIAAEKSFETQLQGFAKQATYHSAAAAFSAHAEETREQYELLTNRLSVLGGSPSTLKSLMAHIFNMAPSAAQMTHAPEEVTTQDLIMAFSVENAEMAMYQALITAAESAADMETAALARRIQAQEKATAEKVWPMIAPAATLAYHKVSVEEGRNTLIRYLQDAEAAEQNFEDALGSFGKTGDQSDVQSLMTMMSRKAKTQHERLEARLMQLGATRSPGKSLLAHMIAFTPVSAQLGHAGVEKNTQHLMITFAAAAAEMGMYEALAAAAEAAGDVETTRLARLLQVEEKEDHTLAWRQIERLAERSMSVAGD